ncbi:MAG: vWA domain-containing protein [Acidobacteriota bacterium]
MKSGSILLLICLLLSLAGCTEPTEPSAVSTIPVPPPAEVPSEGDDLPLSGALAWPPALPDDGSTPQLADDLYATNVMIVLDVSGSMAEDCLDEIKIIAAKRAVLSFIDDAPTDANIGLAIFGGPRDKVVVPLSPEREQLRRYVTALDTGGGTPMATAVGHAYQALLDQSRFQAGYGWYHMVVVGDGVPDSEEATIATLDAVVAQSRVNLHTVGFCANLSVLQRPGTFYRNAPTPEALREAFESVLAEAPSFSATSFQDL